MFPSNGSYFLKFQPGLCTFIAFRLCKQQGHHHLHVSTLSCNIQRRDVLAAGLESTAAGSRWKLGGRFSYKSMGSTSLVNWGLVVTLLYTNMAGWNIPIFNRKYIFRGSIFHCYVTYIPECNLDKWLIYPSFFIYTIHLLRITTHTPKKKRYWHSKPHKDHLTLFKSQRKVTFRLNNSPPALQQRTKDAGLDPKRKSSSNWFLLGVIIYKYRLGVWFSGMDRVSQWSGPAHKWQSANASRITSWSGLEKELQHASLPKSSNHTTWHGRQAAVSTRAWASMRHLTTSKCPIWEEMYLEIVKEFRFMGISWFQPIL